jgi:prolyl oligopeptidase
MPASRILPIVIRYFLGMIAEYRNIFTKDENRLKEIQNYPKYRVPFKKGNKYFYWFNEGLQNQSVLYTQDSLASEPKEFLDPNKLSSDGTASIGTTRFSK